MAAPGLPSRSLASQAARVVREVEAVLARVEANAGLTRVEEAALAVALRDALAEGCLVGGGPEAAGEARDFATAMCATLAASTGDVVDRVCGALERVANPPGMHHAVGPALESVAMLERVFGRDAVAPHLPRVLCLTFAHLQGKERRDRAQAGVALASIRRAFDRETELTPAVGHVILSEWESPLGVRGVDVAREFCDLVEGYPAGAPVLVAELAACAAVMCLCKSSGEIRTFGAKAFEHLHDADPSGCITALLTCPFDTVMSIVRALPNQLGRTVVQELNARTDRRRTRAGDGAWWHLQLGGGQGSAKRSERRLGASQPKTLMDHADLELKSTRRRLDLTGRGGAGGTPKGTLAPESDAGRDGAGGTPKGTLAPESDAARNGAGARGERSPKSDGALSLPSPSPSTSTSASSPLERAPATHRASPVVLAEEGDKRMESITAERQDRPMDPREDVEGGILLGEDLAHEDGGTATVSTKFGALVSDGEDESPPAPRARLPPRSSPMPSPLSPPRLRVRTPQSSSSSTASSEAFPSQGMSPSPGLSPASKAWRRAARKTTVATTLARHRQCVDCIKAQAELLTMGTRLRALSRHGLVLKDELERMSPKALDAAMHRRSALDVACGALNRQRSKKMVLKCFAAWKGRRERAELTRAQSALRELSLAAASSDDARLEIAEALLGREARKKSVRSAWHTWVRATQNTRTNRAEQQSAALIRERDMLEFGTKGALQDARSRVEAERAVREEAEAKVQAERAVREEAEAKVQAEQAVREEAEARRLRMAQRFARHLSEGIMRRVGLTALARWREVTAKGRQARDLTEQTVRLEHLDAAGPADVGRGGAAALLGGDEEAQYNGARRNDEYGEGGGDRGGVGGNNPANSAASEPLNGKMTPGSARAEGRAETPPPTGGGDEGSSAMSDTGMSVEERFRRLRAFIREPLHESHRRTPRRASTHARTPVYGSASTASMPSRSPHVVPLASFSHMTSFSPVAPTPVGTVAPSPMAMVAPSPMATVAPSPVSPLPSDVMQGGTPFDRLVSLSSKIFSPDRLTTELWRLDGKDISPRSLARDDPYWRD